MSGNVVTNSRRFQFQQFRTRYMVSVSRSRKKERNLRTSKYLGRYCVHSKDCNQVYSEMLVSGCAKVGAKNLLFGLETI